MNGTTKLTDMQVAAEIESLRRKARPLLVVGAVMLGLCVAVAMIFLLLRETGSFDSVPFPAVLLLVGIGVAGVVLMLIGNSYMRKVKGVIGRHLVHGVLEEFFDVDAYDVKKHISENVIRSTGMVRGWKHSRGSDYLRGTYKTFGIEFSDVELYYVEANTDKKGNDHEREVTVFKGPWIICEHNKGLPARLLVCESRVRLAVGEDQKDENDLNTESEAFNARYEIRTEDPHTAFYILTPHFMEKIQEINDSVDGRLLLCFEENRLHIAIDNRLDSFEVSSKAAEFKNLDTLRSRFRSEIGYLTAIIDEFMQNQTLFK